MTKISRLVVVLVFLGFVPYGYVESQVAAFEPPIPESTIVAEFEPPIPESPSMKELG